MCHEERSLDLERRLMIGINRIFAVAEAQNIHLNISLKVKNFRFAYEIINNK